MTVRVFVAFQVHISIGHACGTCRPSGVLFSVRMSSRIPRLFVTPCSSFLHGASPAAHRGTAGEKRSMFPCCWNSAPAMNLTHTLGNKYSLVSVTPLCHNIPMRHAPFWPCSPLSSGTDGGLAGGKRLPGFRPRRYGPPSACWTAYASVFSRSGTAWCAV